jgi:hypothetical protein
MGLVRRLLGWEYPEENHLTAGQRNVDISIQDHRTGILRQPSNCAPWYIPNRSGYMDSPKDVYKNVHGGVVQCKSVVEHLPSILETVGSMPRTIKKKKFTEHD